MDFFEEPGSTKSNKDGVRVITDTQGNVSVVFPENSKEFINAFDVGNKLIFVATDLEDEVSDLRSYAIRKTFEVGEKAEISYSGGAGVGDINVLDLSPTAKWKVTAGTEAKDPSYTMPENPMVREEFEYDLPPVLQLLPEEDSGAYWSDYNAASQHVLEIQTFGESDTTVQLQTNPPDKSEGNAQYSIPVKARVPPNTTGWYLIKPQGEGAELTMDINAGKKTTLNKNTYQVIPVLNEAVDASEVQLLAFGVEPPKGYTFLYRQEPHPEMRILGMSYSQKTNYDPSYSRHGSAQRAIGDDEIESPPLMLKLFIGKALSLNVVTVDKQEMVNLMQDRKWLTELFATTSSMFSPPPPESFVDDLMGYVEFYKNEQKGEPDFYEAIKVALTYIQQSGDRNHGALFVHALEEAVSTEIQRFTFPHRRKRDNIWLWIPEMLNNENVETKIHFGRREADTPNEIKTIDIRKTP